MTAVKGKDSTPELALRRALHREGLRYRIHPRDVPGKPDLVNRARKLAIFVDGDFWHANPDDWRRRGFDSLEAQFRPDNRDRWVAKLHRNVERDREVTDELESQGWRVLRIWESEIRTDLDAVITRIRSAWL
jgi:DNA mismatch endonuclease, patch repair protein